MNPLNRDAALVMKLSAASLRQCADAARGDGDGARCPAPAMVIELPVWLCGDLRRAMVM